MAYETIKIEIDEEVKRQAEQILETNHLTMEQAIQSFFQWMVQSPDEARKELMRWKEEKNRDEN
ncbi:hypothetical protein [Lachnoclostridium sp. An181]|uniref:hypothetical protein n=1 Tax=Lachnoclostridium sp. An181 TaxID=1965575 RepID=UPI000B376E54|nr:hypothetical protein [Lachnoclostridium sp. An181]OUP49622.1 hypothetical protein B5F18_07455 [Lachnoclostridium sp. An181]